ncbi:MAG TPA: metalloregulator ArsR/SmtB family transcription factor [Candidatus Binatia bacterium]|nr:metalloregulator ArsR/SmtB family transcription factor [Candidatus Binatia bacterium]
MNNGVPDIIARMGGLADVTRARTLRLVEQHELTVADLCAVLQLPQSTVSRHLKLLADDGWVTARAEGTSRLYRMDGQHLDSAARRLWALIREHSAQTRRAAHDDQRLASIVAARQTRSQAFFNSSAGQWDRLRREMFGDRFDAVALTGLLEDTWVMGDLGCGTGQVSETVAPFVRGVIAVDSSRAMLKAARQRLASFPQVDIRHGDLSVLPIDDGSLDAAVTCLVLHHVADPPAVLRAAARVLRPAGRLLVIDMLAHERREYQQQMGHVWLGFEPSQITNWLHDAGFERPRVQPLPPAAQAKGPALFAASARRARSNAHSKSRRESR